MSLYRQGIRAAPARSGTVVGQGDVSWTAPDLIDHLNQEHAALAAMWPDVRGRAPTLSREQKITWNALVYVLQDYELQAVRLLAQATGGRYEPTAGLGVFSGLPGGGTAHDPNDARFRIVTLRLERTSQTWLGGENAIIGIAPLVIGAYLLFGVVVAALAAHVIIARTDILSGQKTARENFASNMELRARAAPGYAAYAEQEQADGRTPLPFDRYMNAIAPPPPPPPPPQGGGGLGWGLALGAAAVLGGGYLLSRRTT